ncbi:hypothetical protein RB653_002292 [Dictyostelium firmibasis]|uniref:Uncharacterized protein n=1 Tax=Dictyostelium firmibasis TaxID=79012 RepID=A0AAN7YPX4_9MYCE
MEKELALILKGLSLEDDENELKKSVDRFYTISGDKKLEIKTIKSLLPPIVELLKKWKTISNQNIISTALKAISSLVNDEISSEEVSSYFVNINLTLIIQRILNESIDSKIYGQITLSSLSCIGDLILNSNYLLNNIASNSFITIVTSKLMKSTNPKIIRECYWIISNIVSDNHKFLQLVIDSGFLMKLITDYLEPENLNYETNDKIKYEMYWCIINSLDIGELYQFQLIISEYKCLQFLQCAKKNLKKISSEYYQTITKIIVKTLEVCQKERSTTFYKKFISDSFITSILEENDGDLDTSNYENIKYVLTNLNNFIKTL